MKTNIDLSRRHFISASLGASAVILVRRRLSAAETGIVPTMIKQRRRRRSRCTHCVAISAFWKARAVISPFSPARVASFSSMPGSRLPNRASRAPLTA